MTKLFKKSSQNTNMAREKCEGKKQMSQVFLILYIDSGPEF